LTAIWLASWPARSQETVVIAPGERYRAGWFSRVLFGNQWRDIWTTRLEVPLLQLADFDGGLTPVVRGGGLQTKNLHLESGNGREWVFRSVDKDPTRVLDEEVAKSLIGDIFQDLTSTSNPMGALVVAPLLDVAGVLHATPQLVVMPDDKKRLREFSDFVGVLGMFEERPERHIPDQRKVSTTLKLFKRLERRSDEQVDARDYLTARLMDIFVGDWDRHQDQWRWVRFDGGDRRFWRPVPRDRDQAFCRFDGIVPSVAEYYTKQLASFGEKYPSIEKLTYSGRYTDRRFLVGLERREWEEVTGQLVAKLTDAAITDAVHHLPPEVEASEGAALAATLRARRDRLADASHAFYLLLAETVDVRGTDPADTAEVTSGPDRSVEVALHAVGAENRLFFHRLFRRDETSEIRLFMPGGKDTVHFTGDPAIRVRVVAPSSEEIRDRFAGPSAEDAPISDDARRRYETTRDWGHDWLFFPQLSFDSSRGLLAGGRALLTRYGFELDPFEYQMNFAAAYATGLTEPRFEYRADVRTRTPVRALLYVLYSGVDTVNFFGIGNETVIDPTRSAAGDYRVPQDQLLIHPMLEVAVAGPLRSQLGITFKRVSNESDSPAAAAFPDVPYGFAAMELGSVDAGLTVDTRTGSLTAERGVRLQLIARHFPKLFDTTSAFTKLRGEASGVVGAHVLTDLLFGLRVAGEKNFGTYPFFEAAFIGGAASPPALDVTGLTSGNLLRGYDLNRFAGDASLVANADLRLALGRYSAVLPLRYGLLGVADVGRVFVTSQASSRWHTGVGGGAWLSLAAAGAGFGVVSTINAVVVRSDERITFYLATGFGI
jgi:hypothetical protein